MRAWRVNCALACAAAALLADTAAETLVYTNFPWGKVTVFDDSGPATRLTAELPGLASEELIYANATSLPAVAEARTGAGSAERVARATLTIGESNIAGLAVDGAAALVGSNLPLSSARVSLTLVIQLFQGAVIRVADLTSLVPSSGGLAFTLAPSNADGEVLGGSLAWSGPSDDRYFVSSSAGFYRLDMDAFTQGTSPGTTRFSYRFDLDSIASVPEPSAVGLGIAALAVLLPPGAGAGTQGGST